MMDTETRYLMVAVMLMLLSFINIAGLRYSFKRFIVNPQNQSTVRKYKRKWGLLFFSDIIFYLVALFALMGITSSLYKAIMISLFITFIYQGFISNLMEKDGASIFGTRSMKRNADITINTDEQLFNSSGVRKLTIIRKKAYVACLMKIHFFMETEDYSDDNSAITIDGNCFKKIGSIPNGKAITFDVPSRSVKMLVCTFFYMPYCVPINITHLTISSGEKNIVLNIKPVMSDPKGVSSGVSFIIEEERL